jgi:hypothetical protein
VLCVYVCVCVCVYTLTCRINTRARTHTHTHTHTQVALDAADATRPMLAALLQTGWGVAPTHEHFSGKKQTSEVNFVWSAANKPLCVANVLLMCC